MTERTRRRIYGAEPDPYATLPGHEYVQLLVGPLDGQLLNITGLTPEQRDIGVHLIAPHSTYGGSGRSLYAPAERLRRDGAWVWRGDLR
ncbi:hypothetical protein ACFVY7_18330 [[Kitasatospora] papulosa]|uniref:hypothetical protein n=1 Tax=[Kitasatospora] papulosa TaxID=1464011 RepID=UPI0036860E61